MYWVKVTELSQGNYTCRAIKKETGENDIKDFLLQAIPSESPKIHYSNFENGSVRTVQLMQDFNLTCNFSGVPRPELKWFKCENDEKTAVNLTDRNHIELEGDGEILYFKFSKETDEGKYLCEAKYGQLSDQRSVYIEISMCLISLCL